MNKPRPIAHVTSHGVVVAAGLMVNIFVAGTGPAWAGKCDNLKTSEMIDCFGDEVDQTDTRLNAAYKKLMADEDETGKILLRDAQRAWLRFRDAQCDWEADSMRGGTGAMSAKLSCQAKLTADRAIEFERAFKNHNY